MSRQDYLLEYAKENFIPIILDDSKEFMINLCKSHSFKRILEIGTAIGYSGSIILKYCENANLTTIELNKKSFDRKTIKNQRHRTRTYSYFSVFQASGLFCVY